MARYAILAVLGTVGFIVGCGSSGGLAATASAGEVCGPTDPCTCDATKDPCCKPDECKPPTCDSSKEVCADCSPGFYKKHPLSWCPGTDLQNSTFTCPAPIGTVTCYSLVHDWLSAEDGATEQERAAAKACLDAFFGTAEASPCSDDD